MDNKILLGQAAEHLLQINPQDTDTIEIQTSKYDDGSTMLTINVAFLIPEDEITVSTNDNELIASISLTEKNAIVKEGYKVSGYDKT